LNAPIKGTAQPFGAEDIIVEMRDITKRFPGVTANDKVSIAIKRGEIFALLGENGAGKSTLMSMLFGLYEPDSGEIYINGKRERISSPAYASSLSIGMVHQHFRLVEDFTVAENIVLGQEPRKRFLGVFPFVDMRSANERIAGLSKRFGLDADPKALIKDASISLRQRVEILKMLYREAEILIFDEPTAMLAPQEVEYLLQILDNLRDQGKTVIFITHKLNEVKRTADRCAVLNHGKLAGVFNIGDISVRELAACMVGRELDDEAPPPTQGFGDEILSVRGLSVFESGAKRVDGVTFSIRAGEVFAVAGVDGNGQTQLADAIAGLLRPSDGNILLSGQNITQAGVRERIAAGMSYVPEDRHGTGLLLDFPLTQNLALKRYYREPFSRRGILNERAFADYAEKLINAFDIRSGRGGSTVMRSMSGGNQQKAVVAREIDLESKLMIFVQPTRGLDIGAIRAIHEHILTQREAGRAILLISMELEEISALADTIGVMFRGKMNRIAAASELSTDEIGEYMMGVRTD